MKKSMLGMLFLAALAGSALHGQNLTGDWQGTLKAGPQDLRLVIKISLADDKLKAVLYSIDQPGPGIPMSAITRDGSAIKMTVAPIGGSFEGKLSADGNSIAGTWTQGQPLPLNLTRATPQTAWPIPEPPPPPKVMAEDATPAFEVATIKPAGPEERFSILVNRSGLLNTTNTSVYDLIKFAYDIHPQQIKGGPDHLYHEPLLIGQFWPHTIRVGREEGRETISPPIVSAKWPKNGALPCFFTGTPPRPATAGSGLILA